MNKPRKYYLLTILVLAVLFLMPQFGEAAAEKTAGTVVAASGYGELKFEPDLSEITLGVQTEAQTVTAAQAQNAKIANGIFEELLAIGVKKSALKTSGYSVSPIYQSETTIGTKKQVISGYRVSNSVIVTTSPENVSKIIDVALKNGANRVNNLRFSLEDNKKATQDTISLAVRDALTKIDSIARTLGKKVVRIQSVAEQGTNLRVLESNYMFAAKQAGDSYESTPISAGTVTISANVQVTAELE